jgi:hypothetical protein
LNWDDRKGEKVIIPPPEHTHTKRVLTISGTLTASYSGIQGVFILGLNDRSMITMDQLTISSTYFRNYECMEPPEHPPYTVVEWFFS